MGLVSSSIPNLLNGVSQQPGPLRQPNQAELQENALSDVADGLKKRPPTRFEGYLPAWSPGDTYNPVDYIENLKDDSTFFKFFVFQGLVCCLVVWRQEILAGITGRVRARMFSIAGLDSNTPTVRSDVVVFGNSSGDYLETTNPKRDLDILVTADRVYVLNKSKTVSIKADTAVHTSVVNLSDTVHSFSDLPDGTTGNTAYPGAFYKILGAATTAFDHYYVRALSGNTYEETARPNTSATGDFSNENTEFDEATLPIQIQVSLQSVPVWSANTINWDARSCGDRDIVPDPSFVGNTINGMFFYKNRLGFISGEEVVFSAAGDFFNFWPKTATTLLDDAPIDVSLKYTDGTALTHAIVFNESLTVFSENKQFSIDSAGPLTQQTISVTPSTDFDVNSEIPPVGAQNVLYFASDKGGHTSIKEYFVEADTVRSDALELTAHVPKYIPKDIKQLVPSESNDMLFALTKEGRVFVYKYFTDGQKKLQASWSEWVFPAYDKIVAIYAHKDKFFMLADVTTHPTQSLFCASLNFNDKVTNSNALDADGNTINYIAHLDNYTVSDQTGAGQYAYATYNSALNETTISFSQKQVYFGTRREDLALLIEGIPTEFSLTSVDGSTANDKVYVKGEVGTGATGINPVEILVGHKYSFKYQLSPQYIRENNGQQAVQSGRLQLKSMQVGFSDTGYFKVDVTPKNRETFTHEFTGQRVNQLGSTIGSASISEGTFKFPVMSKNDTVKVEINSDSFLPCAFQTVDWEGFYTIRSKRI